MCVCVRTSCCSCALLAVQTPLGHCKIRTYGRTVNATYSSVFTALWNSSTTPPPSHPTPPDLTGFYDARNPERLLFAVQSRVSSGPADQWRFRSGRSCCDTSPPRCCCVHKGCLAEGIDTNLSAKRSTVRFDPPLLSRPLPCPVPDPLDAIRAER